MTVAKGARLGEYRVLEVQAVVENTGPLATHTARGADLRGNRQDVAWLLGDRGAITFLQGTPWQQLGVIDGALAVPGFAAQSGGAGRLPPRRPRRPRGGGRTRRRSHTGPRRRRAAHGHLARGRDRQRAASRGGVVPEGRHPGGHGEGPVRRRP